MAAPPEVNIGNLTGRWIMGVSWWTRQALKIATVTLHVKQYEGPPRENASTVASPADTPLVATPPVTSTSPRASPTEQQEDPLQEAVDTKSSKTAQQASLDEDVSQESPQPLEAKYTHIDIAQTATGGIKGTTEKRILDWVARQREDSVFGKGRGQSRWIDLDVIEDDYLKEGWLGEESSPDDAQREAGGPDGQKYVETYLESERGWTARQVWGFARVNEKGGNEGERYYVRRVVVIKGDKTLRIRLVYNYEGAQP